MLVVYLVIAYSCEFYAERPSLLGGCTSVDYLFQTIEFYQSSFVIEKTYRVLLNRLMRGSRILIAKLCRFENILLLLIFSLHICTRGSFCMVNNYSPRVKRFRGVIWPESFSHVFLLPKTLNLKKKSGGHLSLVAFGSERPLSVNI